MKYLSEIGNNSKQVMTVVQDNGESFTLALEYRPTQEAWYYSIMKDSFIINNHKLVVHPNILRKYIKQINFGLLVTTIDGKEPFHIEDFTFKRTKIFLLNSEECDQAELVFYTPYNEQGLD